MSLNYEQAGVNIEAGTEAVRQIKPLVEATHNANVLTGLTNFAAAYALPEVAAPVMVAATDGVGTKLLLALQCNQHETIGIDLVAMVANDLLASGAKPLFFLDYMATDALVPEQVRDVVAGIAYGCQQAQMALIGGETAEMPGMYPQGHYDLAGFAVGVVSRAQMLPQHVSVGDVLIGLPSSGVHSNGFSLVRALLAETNLANTPLADGTEIMTALMRPTTIYVNQVLPLIEQGLIHGLAHITGGGFTDNVPRMLQADQAAVIQADSWQWPELFQRLQQAGGLSLAEMRKTFNCGIGMVLAVHPSVVASITAAIPHSTVIGRVAARDGEQVVWA